MDKNLKRIEQLYFSYKEKNISAIEFHELLELLKNNDVADNKMVELILDDVENADLQVNKEIIERITNVAEQKIFSNIEKPKSFKWWYRIAAILVVILSVSLLFFQYLNIDHDLKANNASDIEDILPSSNNATLKISDGRTFKLADESPLLISDEKKIEIGDEIIDIEDRIVELELLTPKKANYKTILPDGTKALLNAESSIIYPSKFSKNERRIKITGEVYLEVAKVTDSKFFVELIDGNNIEVLGTKFNINSYPENKNIKTSLAEGKIKLNTPQGKSVILLPGQKAINNRLSNHIEISNTSIGVDLAWVNSKFNFEGMNFKEIMNQISRWYDVEIIYLSSEPKVEFYGELDKNNSLNYIIDVFKDSGIKMKLQNKKLLID